MDKSEKAIIVTGALGGIGAEIVKFFRNKNWFVIPIDIRACADTTSVDLAGFDLDRLVREPIYRNEKIEVIRNLLPSNLERLVLVNNAAVQKLAPTADLSKEDWDETLSINVLAPFFLSQGLFEDLRDHDGRVVNIGSIHADLTKPEFSAYATSKGALATLTKALAIEWAPYGVSVNSIAPAAIDTPMLKDGFLGKSSEMDRLASYHPTRVIGTPKDVASSVFMLAEFEGKFLTGAKIELSGGIGSVLHDPA